MEKSQAKLGEGIGIQKIVRSVFEYPGRAEADA
jgi:hypothetical protein